MNSSWSSITASLQFLAPGDDFCHSWEAVYVTWVAENSFDRHILQTKLIWVWCCRKIGALWPDRCALISCDRCRVQKHIWQSDWRFHTALFTANLLRWLAADQQWQITFLVTDLFNCCILHARVRAWVHFSEYKGRRYEAAGGVLHFQSICHLQFPMHLAWCALRVATNRSETGTTCLTAGWLLLDLLKHNLDSFITLPWFISPRSNCFGKSGYTY